MKTRQVALVGTDAGIVAVILALVAFSLPPTSGFKVSVSSTSSTAPLVFSSAVAESGLQVKLYLNSTSMRFNGSITGFVTVANTLDQNVTVTPLQQDLNLSTWPAYWVRAIDPCGSVYFPGGYAVFQGHLTAENISSVAESPLVLTPGPGGSCSEPPTTRGAITFLPGGGQEVGGAVDLTCTACNLPNQLNVTQYVCAGNPGTQPCSNPESPSGLFGYWPRSSVCSGNPTCTSSPPFTTFSPGEYTIVAWDDWDQYVYVTFVVQPGS